MYCKMPEYSGWLKVMIKKLNELEKMRCQDNCQVIVGAPWCDFISCRFIFKDGSYERHRARLVAMGYQQEKGRDYFESFPATCCHSAIQLVLALTSVSGCHSLDFGAACAFISWHRLCFHFFNQSIDQLVHEFIHSFIHWSINGMIKERRVWAVICGKWFTYYIKRINNPSGLGQKIWTAAHFVS